MMDFDAQKEHTDTFEQQEQLNDLYDANVAYDDAASDVVYDDAYKKNDEVADDAPAADVATADADVATADADVVTPGEALPSDRVADLVEYVVCGLVDDANAVSLDVIDSAQGTLIEVTCSEQDTGKVIGRRGRTIKAIRTLARALGQRVGTSVDVEVLG